MKAPAKVSMFIAALSIPGIIFAVRVSRHVEQSKAATPAVTSVAPINSNADMRDRLTNNGTTGVYSGQGIKLEFNDDGTFKMFVLEPTSSMLTVIFSKRPPQELGLISGKWQADVRRLWLTNLSSDHGEPRPLVSFPLTWLNGNQNLKIGQSTLFNES